ncbi:MAG: DMT family transporter [Burkholderiales bacterium]
MSVSATSAFYLILLSALWGGSFLFLRIAAPVLGPVPLIFARVLLAALFLTAVGRFLKKLFDLRGNARHYFIIGVFNSALPFLLFAYAAQTVSASLLSILNATAPLWAALIGACWHRSPLGRKQLIGLMLGVAGVWVLAGIEFESLQGSGWSALAAGLAAAISYGIASTYAGSAKSVDPFANAHGSMWAASLVCLPLLFLPATTDFEMPSIGIAAAVFTLGVFCSGFAYLLYFRLIADIGAVSALCVTFLIPVFGVLFGFLFLNEPIGLHTIAGAAMVLAGTALVVNFSPAALLKQKPTAR